MRHPASSPALNPLSVLRGSPSGLLPGPRVKPHPWPGRGLPRGIIFDLFGTLVPAPSSGERAMAAARFAGVLGVRQAVVEEALSRSWDVRHNGTLRTTADVAAHLVAEVHAPAGKAGDLQRAMRRLATIRLRADTSVHRALARLRHWDVRLVLLSDASADIAEAWDGCALRRYFAGAVFSSRTGALKPDPTLYERALSELAVPAESCVYCGDGGGQELTGATRAGLRPVRVARRGGPGRLAYGAEASWQGPTLPSVEDLGDALFSPGNAR
ncbi:putative hydrolase of the HAD superfamily [Streptomyces sp. HB372]|nr:putative hydrolase of the HAD superfamily [Streptomyces sp. HB372]